MAAETQGEPIVLLSGAAANEPIILTDLECQVKATEGAATQEMVTLVMKDTEPMGPPPIETRTIETQRGNYMTINMRVLEELGRVEASA